MVASISVWAKSGTLALPGVGPVPFWGFAPSGGGTPQLPGPMHEVWQGDNVQFDLHNDLTVPTSLVFGLEFTPQPVKDAQGVFEAYNTQAAPGGSVSYTFTAVRPGAFRYESGTAQERQIQMGLYGLIIVRPTGFNPGVPSTWTAYGPGTGTEFDVERVLVLGEVDVTWHQAIIGGDPLGDFDPGHFVLNGRSYPDTVAPDDSSSQPFGSRVTASTGQRVLLRVVNAGFLNHTLRLEGVTARVVAGDGWPLVGAIDATYQQDTLTIGSGQSCDLIFTAPAAGKYLVYDRDLGHVVNDNQFPGGILTWVEVA